MASNLLSLLNHCQLKALPENVGPKMLMVVVATIEMAIFLLLGQTHMGGSINGGTPKWLVYNGNSH